VRLAHPSIQLREAAYPFDFAQGQALTKNPRVGHQMRPYCTGTHAHQSSVLFTPGTDLQS
jgi:hypothetical protein